MKPLTIFLLSLLGLAGLPGSDNGRGLIVGQVLEAETNQPIACTVTIRASDGSLVTEHPGFKGGFRSGGRFEKSVPPGETTVTVSRGFDYGAVEQKLNLRAGGRAELNIRLQRRTPLRAQGWYAGDNHAHMVHGERKIAVDFPYVALAGRAEGLDYLAVAQHWDLPQVTPENLAEACRRVSTPDFLLTWNMEIPKNYWRGNVSHCMGHGWTVAMRGRTPDGVDAIAELTGMSAWDYESDKVPTPNFESHMLIHRLGGIVSYTHPCRWWRGKWGGRGGYPVEEDKFVSNMAAELPFDTVAGPTYDMIDILMQPHERVANEQAQQLWFMLLNHGYRIAGTASSDATFDNEGRGVPGKVRVYTRVAGAPTLDRIAAAMKAGRNFVTSGPLLTLEIGGNQVGDVVRVKQPVKLKARLRAWASGAAGERLTKVELIRNGEVVDTFAAGEGNRELAAEFEVAEAKTAWYVARAFGSNHSQVAITNPIYFAASDYRAPQPTLARVTGVVTDKLTGRPLDGVCEVISMLGQKPVRQARHRFKGGQFTLSVPATARLRIHAPGYAPALKSVFMDYPPLLNLSLNMRAEQMLDWQTYEKTRALLREVKLDFPLVRGK